MGLMCNIDIIPIQFYEYLRRAFVGTVMNLAYNRLLGTCY